MSTHARIQNTEVRLHSPPAVSGLKFRKFRGEVDYHAMLAVINGSKGADRIERTDTLEDIARNYEYLLNCDPYQDVLIAEVNREVIGYNRVFWEKLDDGTRTYSSFGFMLPSWRRRGIGRAMLLYAEQRLREIAAKHPEDGPRFFRSWAADTETGTRHLLLSEGYQPVRFEFEMVRDLSEPFPEAPMPEGLEVRPVETDHLWLIHDAMNEAFLDHWGHRDVTKEEFKQWMKDPVFEPKHWKVAWDEDQVAGMVMNFINITENEEYNRKRGYTENISVRRPWRKRGLARSLIVQSLHYLKQLGMSEAGLSVDTQNPNGALSLYKSVGFQPTKQHIDYQKPLD